MSTIFLRALEVGDKGAMLRAAIHQPDITIGKQRFEIDPKEFRSIPTSPFAYWVSADIRKIFSKLPLFESKKPERRATKGLATTDDNQFLRLWWELQPQRIPQAWFSFAKGGPTSPFYADLPTYVLWENNGARLKAYLDHKIGKSGQWSRWINSTNYYNRAGITWALRAARFSPQALPKDSVFSVRGYAAFSEDKDLSFMLAVFNSSIFDYLFKLALGRFGHPEFVVGVLQWLPWAATSSTDGSGRLSGLAVRAWNLKRSVDTRKETSHAFVLPALMQSVGNTLALRADAWVGYVDSTATEFTAIQLDIDNLCFDLYQITQEDRNSIGKVLGESSFAGVSSEIISGFDVESDNDVDTEADDESEIEADAATLAAELVSWAVGVAVGRFDVRFAIGARPLPNVPSPFDSLPICSPAILTGDDGFPVVRVPTEYPIQFPENGVLVDDSGHTLDLATAVRVVVELVFKADINAWWEELGAILDPKGHEIRSWLNSDFFAYHLKSYSKSRRKAPILWQLAVPSGHYCVWLYSQRLTGDSFFRLQSDVVAPKLTHEERKLTSLVQGAGANPSAKARKEITEQEVFVEEIRAFLNEIKRVSPLWNPNLDDGVVLTMAPLWRLVPQHKPWQKELHGKWNELAAGKCDWAHVAMHLWPERVVPKCATDRSLAIAHGLEDVFWVEDEDGKWDQRPVPTRSVDALVRERTSIAVKAALQGLTEASALSGSKTRTRKSSL